MSPKVIAGILIAILAVIGLYLVQQYWLNPATEGAEAAGPGLMEPMPDVTLQAPDGSNVVLREKYTGKTLVINFWATWCLPCRVEIPFFNQVYNEFKDRGVVFIAISEDVEGWPVVNEFVKEIPIEYPLLLDVDGSVGEAFGGLAGLPITVFVDSEGRITRKHIGISDIDDLRANIERMLEPADTEEEALGEETPGEEATEEDAAD